MRWQKPLLAATGVLTLLTAIGRYEDGKTGFLLWAPFVTSLLSFAALVITGRSGSTASTRDYP